MGTLANSEEPDEVPRSGSALFAKIKTILGAKVHINLESLACDPLYKQWTIPNLLHQTERKYT